MSIHDPLPHHRLSLMSIVEAAGAIDETFLHTAQYESPPLSRTLGCSLLLKVETSNPIGSFKGRGADYFMRKVVERGETRRLVCASTGNFGQAMAYAGRRHSRAVIVYADLGANPLKVSRIRELGGEVRLVGEDFDAAKDAAREFCAETGAWMIEDGREPEISEGAGTIGVELAQASELDLILVPVGNGALITGVARWLKAVMPQVQVVGVSAIEADSMAASWRGHRVVERRSAATIAEGIAVRRPVPEAVEDMIPIVDEMALVTDESMIEAMRVIRDKTGHLVEPSGAVGVAAVLGDPRAYAGRRVATILTGNNVTADQVGRWLG
ncbi:MAG: threonine/serine dehydratase [Acidimicrobiia bacterium]